MNTQKRIGLSFLVLFILGVSGLLLFAPSARTVKHGKVLTELAKKYKTVNPNALSPILNGNLVIVGNNFRPISRDETALLSIWTGQSSSSTSYRLINNMFAPSQVGVLGREYKKAILVAPNPESIGWTLFGKTLIAYYLMHKHINFLFQEMGEIAGNPKKGIAMLQKKWDAIPKPIQVQTEQMLTENRETLQKYPKEGLILQTGLGSHFDIENSNTDLVLRIVEDNLPWLPPAK